VFMLNYMKNSVWKKNWHWLNKLILSAISLFFVTIASAQERYQSLHNKALVVDMHTDVLQQVMRGADISQLLDYGHVDLVRLKRGGVDVQFFAVWPNPALYKSRGMFQQSMHMIDLLENIIEQNKTTITLARNPQEIRAAVNEQKIAACIGVEGGTAIESDLNKLQILYDRGARYMGLTWNDSPEWASSAKNEYYDELEQKKGLSDFGKQVVLKMNELGMMVDVSHCGEQTFWDVMAIAQKPLIASHSCVFRLRWHYRNLKDAQIKALAEEGGVVFINFYPAYLDSHFATEFESMTENNETVLDSIKKKYAGNGLMYRKIRNEYYRKHADSFLPGIDRLVDHIDYIVQLVGEDHVGLGSDTDGISILPRGLDDISDLPLVTREMIQRGYSDERIKKILGGNFMRVFSENMD